MITMGSIFFCGDFSDFGLLYRDFFVVTRGCLIAARSSSVYDAIKDKTGFLLCGLPGHAAAITSCVFGRGC